VRQVRQVGLMTPSVRLLDFAKRRQVRFLSCQVREVASWVQHGQASGVCLRSIDELKFDRQGEPGLFALEGPAILAKV